MRRKSVTFQQSKKDASQEGQFTGDIGSTDPKVIVIRWLQSKFGGDVVWADRIHIPDSYVTNSDYLFAVTQVSNPTVARSCKSVFNNMTLDVIVYEREECHTAGSLSLVDKFITATIKEVVGNYGLMTIQDANRVSSRDIHYIEDNFRGRAVSVSIDYGYCI